MVVEFAVYFFAVVHGTLVLEAVEQDVSFCVCHRAFFHFRYKRIVELVPFVVDTILRIRNVMASTDTSEMTNNTAEVVLG
jgi:hypothetical protein